MAIGGKGSDNKCPDNVSCSSSSSSSDCGAGQTDPCRLSRIAEKSELQNLNDRLACYIDRARKLEIENNRLQIDLQDARKNDDVELSNVKGVYEGKICDCKHCIDEISREKSKLEMEVARLYEENDDLRKQLEKALKDLHSAENRARTTDQKLTEMCQKYKTASVELKKCSDNIEFFKGEVDRLKKLLEETRKNLENETLLRIQLENNLCNTRDQLQRNDQVHDQEMKESNAHRLSDINEMNSRLTTQYEAKLRQALHDLREQYEGQIRTNRCEIELIYENKIKNLEKTLNQNAGQANDSHDELKVTRNCITRLNEHIDELNLEINQLKNRNREMEKNAESDKIRIKNKIACLEADNEKLRREINKRIKEYQDLMDIKVSLDMEISAYDKLLRGEECRLGEENLCDQEDAEKCRKQEEDKKACGKCPKNQSCPPQQKCPQKCPPKPKCTPKCHPSKPPKCPQKCPQKCPPTCPQKIPTCPQKCPPPKKQPTPPCCPKSDNSSSSASECSEQMLYDVSPIGKEESFLQPKRCLALSLRSPVPNKRQRTLENFEESDDNKYFVLASSKGLVEICESDPDGYFVKLHNKTNKDLDISGWTIKSVSAKQNATFKFDPNTKLSGNGFISIWSTGSCVTHDPPKVIVMNGQKWLASRKRIETTLTDGLGDEQASSHRIKRVASSRSSSCSGGGFGLDTMHMTNRDNSNFIDQYCALM